MNILIICPCYDPAQTASRLTTAINKHTEHKAKCVVGGRTKVEGSLLLECEHDMVLQDVYSEPPSPEMLAAHETLLEWMREADVIHFNQFDWTCYRGSPHILPYEKHMFVPNFRWDQYISPDQGIVFHGHGGAWLINPDDQAERCEEMGATMITCSPIDRMVTPGVKWMPNILPIGDAYHTPKTRDFSGQLKAGMASGAPVYKGAEIVSYIFEYLNHFGYDIEFEIVTGMPLLKALEIRADHHFTIDNWTQGFFGLAGLEGMSKGHVAFARMDTITEETWHKFSPDMIPIINVHGMDHCAKWLRYYYNDRDALKEKCEEGRSWMEKNYNEKAIVERWIDLYGSI